MICCSTPGPQSACSTKVSLQALCYALRQQLLPDACAQTSLHHCHILCWHLQEGGVVIPAGAVVYGQLVESPILHKCSVSTSDGPLAPWLLTGLVGQGLAAIVCNRMWQAQSLATATILGELCAASTAPAFA